MASTVGQECLEEGGYCITHRPSFRPYSLKWTLGIVYTIHFGPPSQQTRRGTPRATHMHFLIILCITQNLPPWPCSNVILFIYFQQFLKMTRPVNTVM